jgi:hypothetical protein
MNDGTQNSHHGLKEKTVKISYSASGQGEDLIARLSRVRFCDPSF